MSEGQLQRDLEQCVKQAIAKAVSDKLGGYNSPLEPMLKQIIERLDSQLRKLVTDSIESAVGDPEFVAEMRAAMRQKLARSLIDKFGGEIEKQVNALKADPSTRARITLAIDQVVGGGK